MAGALGLLMGGPHTYFGKLVEKPTIGDKIREVEPGDIQRANTIMYACSIVCLLLFGLLRLFLQILLT